MATCNCTGACRTGPCPVSGTSGLGFYQPPRVTPVTAPAPHGETGWRERLIAAIDTLHERAWAEGTGGSQAAHKAADALAAALGWTGDHGTTPDGPWLRARLAEVLR